LEARTEYRGGYPSAVIPLAVVQWVEQNWLRMLAPNSLGGYMKSLLLLWKIVAEELSDECQVSTSRDLETVIERERHEGFSFMTITLPQFCADFQKGLAQGFVDSTLFVSFKKRAGLPAFLSGFLSRVFSSAGHLLDDPDPNCIRAVRQLTLLFSKVEMECSNERTKSAIRAFVQCEQDVRNSDKNRPLDDLRDFTRVGRLLFGQLFTDMDLEVHDGVVRPKHGPGATADALKGNQKWNQKEWTQRLEKIFPALEFLFPSYQNWKEVHRLDILEPGRERPVKVTPVPKTMKTPRIIAVEPTCMQYAQQAIFESFVRCLDRNPVRALLGIDDQSPNNEMARLGSITGSLATLDLSEASDRVSNQLVRALLSDHPWLFQAVDASRSRRASVPDHGVIRLAKFSSMGSATCFPFEACVFLTLVFLGIQRRLGRPLSRKEIFAYAGQVRVFGDDIIVPTDMASSVECCLEAFGLKVNLSKSFVTGKFRESCGKEYYDGHDVSIVKVRRALPTRRTDVQELVSAIALRNLFYGSLMWSTARHLEGIIGRFLKLPRVLPTSPSLGYHSYLGYDVHRQCPSLHTPLVRGYRVVPTIPRSRLEGTGALLKFFLKRSDQPLQEGHLERTGRPTSADIRRGWIQPF
jgi:hypothetical protein